MSRRSRPAKFLIADLRDRKKRCGVFKLTFSGAQLTNDQRRTLEAHLQSSFNRWWDSWVSPLINEAEARLVKPSKKKRGKS